MPLGEAQLGRIGFDEWPRRFTGSSLIAPANRGSELQKVRDANARGAFIQAHVRSNPNSQHRLGSQKPITPYTWCNPADTAGLSALPAAAASINPQLIRNRSKPAMKKILLILFLVLTSSSCAAR